MSETVTQRVRHALESPTTVMTFGRLAIAGVGLLATPLFTRILAVDEYAVYALALGVVTFSATVPLQWLTAATLRFGPQLSLGDIRSRLTVGLLASVPIVALTASVLLMATFRPSPGVFGACVVFAMAESVFTAQWVAARAKLRAYAFVAAGVLRNGLSLVLVTLAAALDSGVAAVTVLLACAAASLSAAILLAVTTRRGAESVRSSGGGDLKQWWSFGWPLIINYALGIAILQVGKFILMHLSTAEDVARFAATFDTMFAMLSLTIGLVGLTTVPRIFGATTKEDQDRLVRRLNRTVGGAVVVIPMLLALAWPLLSKALIGPQVRHTEPVFVVTTAAAMGCMLYRFQYQNIVAQIDKRTTLITVSTGVGLVVVAVASWVAIPAWGLAGASVGALAGAMASLLVMRLARARDMESSQQ